MKRESQEVLVPIKVYTYVADDGTKFDSEYECRQYEKNLELKKNRVIDTAIEGLYDFDDEHRIVIYNILNEEDWNILVENIWQGYQDPKEYPGPGQYIVIKYDGGDYHDDYCVHEARKYVDETRKNFNECAEKIYNAIAKFNT